MVKKISMEMTEYQTDMENFRQVGFSGAIEHICQFISSGKTALEFYGPNSLDPKIQNHAQMIRLLSLLGQGATLPQTIKSVETVSSAPTEQAPEAPQETAPAEQSKPTEAQAEQV